MTKRVLIAICCSTIGILFAMNVATLRAGASAVEKTDDSAAAADAPKLTDLDDVADLKADFSAKDGHVRLIVLVSPTCPICMLGAKQLRKRVLEQYPDADLNVFAVWLPMLPADARDAWNGSLLDDKRVKQYWNGSRSIGKWFAKHMDTCSSLGPVAWDEYYLFDAKARWKDALPAPIACGAPIVRNGAKLADALANLFPKDDEHAH